jgi:hypothetical protein
MAKGKIEVDVLGTVLSLNNDKFTYLIMIKVGEFQQVLDTIYPICESELIAQEQCALLMEKVAKIGASIEDIGD